MTYLFTGNTNVINEVEIKNDTGNAIPVIGVTGSPISVNFTGTTADAFGRLRTSNQFTLFDTKTRYRDHGEFSSNTLNGGNITYVSDLSSFQMTVTNTANSRVYRETTRVFPYQPGKSLLSMYTFCMAPPQSNLRQRVGFFSATNGIFLEQENSNIYFVKRSSASGSVVDNRIIRSSWINDKLDGNGSSGKYLNLTKSQIFWSDVEWLGVGSVRAGFVIDGELILCHTFNHANIESNVYMTTASLPIRYEIENIGPTANASMLTQICSTVISEGGYQQKSEYHVISNAPTAGVDCNLAGTVTPIASIRLRSDRLDAIILPSQLDMLSFSNQPVRFQLILNGTLTGANWTNHPTGSAQYDITANAITGGTVIQEGYLTQGGKIELGTIDNFNYQLGRTIDGVSDIITFVAIGFSNNIKVVGSLAFFELT